jgi:competence protein ComEC
MKSNFSLPRPFFSIALAFISGIALSDYLSYFITSDVLSKIIIIVMGCFILFFITGFLLNGTRKSIILDIVLIFLFFLAGSVRLLVAWHYPANHISNFKVENTPVYLEGIVVDEPLYYQPKDGFSAVDNKLSGYFTINTKTLAWAGQESSVSGKVRVGFYGFESTEDLKTAKYGNCIRILGRLYSTRCPTNPGEFDYRRFLERQGVYKTIRIKNPKDISFLNTNEGNIIWNALQQLRNFLSEKLDLYFNAQQSSLIKALLLGNRAVIPDAMETQFMQTGTIHYLSVSGLHLAMLTGFFFLILGWLNITGRKRAIVLMIIAVLYAMLTGLSTPVSRSLVMIVIFLGAEIFNRESNPFNSLALAALIIAIYNPQEVFSAGAQLSFISVLSIISLSPSLFLLFKYKNIDNSLPTFIEPTIIEKCEMILKKYLVGSITVSLSACFGVFLIVLCYFNIVTPIAVITNIILSPLIFLIMLVGFISLPFTSLGVYSYIVPIVSFLTEVLMRIVSWFSHFPLAYFYMPDIPPAFVWIFYSLFFLWLISYRFKFINWKYFIMVITIFILAFIIWALNIQTDNKREGLVLTMLDVRKGASFVLETPDGKTIIYDAGTTGSRDIGEQVITPFLWNKGINRIDTLILSHSHLDHINGVKSILERFAVRRVVISPYFYYSEDGEKVLKLLDLYQIPVEKVVRGDAINIGAGIIADVLGPPLLEMKKYRKIGQNDLSVVIKIKYQNRAIILSGDIQAKGIDWLFNNDKLNLKGDILQIPHHGHINEAVYGEELMNKVNPKYVLINNEEDEANDNIIEEFDRENIDVLSTFQYGAVTIKITADKLDMIFFKNREDRHD